MKYCFLSVVLFFFSFANAQNWEQDFQKALETAHNQNKNIVLVFSGSDWCAPCIKLDKNIWQSTEFKTYSEDHWVLVKADFPRKKSHQLSEEQTSKNAQLAEKYNREGNFPLVVVLDPKGKVIGKTGYLNISPVDYIKLLSSYKG